MAERKRKATRRGCQFQALTPGKSWISAAVLTLASTSTPWAWESRLASGRPGLANPRGKNSRAESATSSPGARSGTPWATITNALISTGDASTD